ncbi:MAG: tetratricopeptide repeat protein, partial [Planctomycetes bacterium]|nr:tetratricopeptide repeat protein [Planctomycetota bacterium]
MRTCFVKSVFVASLGLCGCAAFRPSTGSSCAEAHALADQARQAEDEGQFERADDLLERALLVNPDDAEIHRRRARLLLNHGDVDGAVAHLRYAIARDPEDAAGLMDLAELLARRGRLPEAERAAHEALSLEPLHVEGLLLVARLATARGGEAEALEIWHRVLGLEPENVEARLGIAEVRLRGEHPEQAAPLLRAVCRTSLAEPDERAQAFWALGRLDASRGRWGETAEAFTAAAALQPGLTADQWYELSFARLKNGEADEARRG